jgi:hypothetical protein
MQAEGTPDRRLALQAKRVGNFAGLKARYLDIKAETVGDYCFRRAYRCRVEIDMAGKCLGEEGEELRLQAREAGDWLMFKPAGAELRARARDAVICVYREAKSLGLRGSGVVYMRHGTPPWRTSFRVEKIP